MRIVIRFKSGFELSITCERFKYSESKVTGELTSYEIEGIKDNKPLYFRPGDVECVYQIIDGRGEADNGQN